MLRLMQTSDCEEVYDLERKRDWYVREEPDAGQTEQRVISSEALFLSQSEFSDVAW